jgi:hypothetical protein
LHNSKPQNTPGRFETDPTYLNIAYGCEFDCDDDENVDIGGSEMRVPSGGNIDEDVVKLIVV